MPHHVTQRGHLWQQRFASFVLDEPHLLAAARYVELNPVRAGLVTAPSEYRWSSAEAHIKRKDDCLGAAVVAGGELATTPDQRGHRRTDQGVPRTRKKPAESWATTISKSASRRGWAAS